MPTDVLSIDYVKNSVAFINKLNELLQKTNQFLLSQQIIDDDRNKYFITLVQHNFDRFYQATDPSARVEPLENLRIITENFYKECSLSIKPRVKEDLAFWSSKLVKFVASWGMGISSTVFSLPYFIWAYLKAAALMMQVTSLLLQTLSTIYELISIVGLMTGFATLASISSLVTLGLGLVVAVGIIAAAVISFAYVFKAAVAIGSMSFNLVEYLVDSIAQCFLVQDDSASKKLESLKQEHLGLIDALGKSLEQQIDLQKQLPPSTTETTSAIQFSYSNQGNNPAFFAENNITQYYSAQDAEDNAKFTASYYIFH